MLTQFDPIYVRPTPPLTIPVGYAFNIFYATSTRRNIAAIGSNLQTDVHPCHHSHPIPSQTDTLYYNLEDHAKQSKTKQSKAKQSITRARIDEPLYTRSKGQVYPFTTSLTENLWLFHVFKAFQVCIGCIMYRKNQVKAQLVTLPPI